MHTLGKHEISGKVTLGIKSIARAFATWAKT